MTTTQPSSDRLALLYRLSRHREAQAEKAMPEVEPETT